MQYIAIALITLGISFASFVGMYKYLPLGAFDSEPLFGTSITTINGSDTLSASRTVINNNFSALNAGKIEVSSSSIAAITTLLNLTSVGTIGTGIWRGTGIEVGYGGTGTTTPSRYLVILGNGTAGLTVASSTGTSGQFLTSNGAGAYPSWQTSAINQADNYNWTGLHNFTAGIMASSSVLNIIASSTQYTINAGSVYASSSLSVAGVSVDGSWQEIGETILVTPASTITVSSLPVRSSLKISVISSSTAASAFNLIFNSDSGANYGYRAYANASLSAVGGATSIGFGPPTTTPTVANFEVSNILGVQKLMTWLFVSGDGANVPTINYGGGTWNSTAQITSVTITSASETFVTGSRVTVYGKKN
jgi:hypothetical protein